MSFESSDSEDPALVFPQHECGLFAVFGHGRLHHSLDAVAAQAAVVADAFDF